jgi:hypothetical protein
MNGRRIFDGQIFQPATVIDLSSYQPGLYFLKVTGDKGTLVEKFIKQ